MPSADPAQFPMETKCAPMLFRRTARRGACQQDDSPERQLIPLCSGNDIALNEPPVQPSTEGEFRPCQSFAEQCRVYPRTPGSSFSLLLLLTLGSVGQHLLEMRKVKKKGVVCRFSEQICQFGHSVFRLPSCRQNAWFADPPPQHPLFANQLHLQCLKPAP